MQLHCETQTSSQFRAFASPARCPNCEEWVVAPLLSEFVEGGEIRHHWVCDGCGETACTTISVDTELAAGE